MRLRVLGCSGGIGGRAFRTTSMLVDEDLLIDAGTGAADLSLTALSRLNHVFLTHSHLDHISSLPLILDAVFSRRKQALTVYALPETIAVLKKHIFNWEIWPDFSVLPNAQMPALRYQPIALGEVINLDGRELHVLPASHVIPAVGYELRGASGSLVFTGDTCVNPQFWEWVNRIPTLRYLIIETAFSDKDRALALDSKHLCPSLLAEELKNLKSSPDIFITHLKPGEIDLTMREIDALLVRWSPRMLQNRQIFVL
jgi:ribonuclease BN (tRNA processing enzyme)